MSAIQTAQRLGASFRRCDSIEARKLAETVKEIYRNSYVKAVESGRSFHSVDAFMARFESYSSLPDLDLVIAYHGDDPIGQTWGWPRRSSREWDGLMPDLGAEFTHEDGRRTFVFSEIMVVQNWTGQGMAHALHDTLLSGRHERRATLLVEPSNTTARRAYEHWGWTKVGQKRPRWEDAPTFDVMIKDLSGTH